MSETSETSHPVLLEVSRVTKVFGDLKAVCDVSFEGRAGEVIGLLGPNGAGKTTILRMLVGTLSPSYGEIRVGGLSMKDHPRQAKAQLGYLPETPPLYNELSVREQLSFAGALRHLRRKESRARTEYLLQQCQLKEVQHQLIRKLSKGFRQRVALAQALLGDPKVMVLDEPTSGLDLAQIEQMRQLIKELSKDRLIIFSTHILQEVAHNCSRILMLSRGDLQKDVSVGDLKKEHSNLEMETLVRDELLKGAGG